MYGSDIIWDDTDLDQLETIPHTDPHRLTDPLVIAADSEGASCLQYQRRHLTLRSCGSFTYRIRTHTYRIAPHHL